MIRDEEAIRSYFNNWMKATKEGDLKLARSLIQEDAFFMVPGGHRMDKESFAQAATATASDPNNEFDLDCSIDEIKVLGDYDWPCTKISLTITKKHSNEPTVMAGHTLSILQRDGEKWVVVREANTMISVDKEN